jgi:hypothetical protein
LVWVANFDTIFLLGYWLALLLGRLYEWVNVEIVLDAGEWGVGIGIKI